MFATKLRQSCERAGTKIYEESAFVGGDTKFILHNFDNSGCLAIEHKTEL